MILLLGGTADTAPLAAMLAEARYQVLVSMATEVPLVIGDHPRISRRTGALDGAGLLGLLSDLGIQALIDAAHPYAEALHHNAREAAARAGIPYLAYVRPPLVPPGGNVIPVSSHEEAAESAFSFHRPVLLTTGSRNLVPYAKAAGQTGLELVVRVLDTEESLKACREAGIPARNVVTGRGSFSLAQNLEVIRKFAIGVIVTKDSGEAGGVRAKWEAAQLAGCRLVVVARPKRPDKYAFEDMPDLVAALHQLLKFHKKRLEKLL